MTSENPFQAPNSLHGGPSGYDRDASDAAVSARSLLLLRMALPWVSLVSVLLWMGVLLMGLWGMLAIVGAMATRDGGAFFMGIIALTLNVGYASLALSLGGYAAAIRALQDSEQLVDLEDALEAQTTFWRRAGIIALVMTLFAAVTLLMML